MFDKSINNLLKKHSGKIVTHSRLQGEITTICRNHGKVQYKRGLKTAINIMLSNRGSFDGLQKSINILKNLEEIT